MSTQHASQLQDGGHRYRERWTAHLLLLRCLLAFPIIVQLPLALRARSRGVRHPWPATNNPPLMNAQRQSQMGEL
jgi:hypothetical protein